MSPLNVFFYHNVCVIGHDLPRRQIFLFPRLSCHALLARGLQGGRGAELAASLSSPEDSNGLGGSKGGVWGGSGPVNTQVQSQNYWCRRGVFCFGVLVPRKSQRALETKLCAGDFWYCGNVCLVCHFHRSRDRCITFAWSRDGCITFHAQRSLYHVSWVQKSLYHFCLVQRSLSHFMLRDRCMTFHGSRNRCITFACSRDRCITFYVQRSLYDFSWAQTSLHHFCFVQRSLYHFSCSEIAVSLLLGP